MLVSLLWFFIIFSVVVIAHEFGHFIIAKANGIHVVEFFVGFGPTLFHFTKGGTKYSLKLLPLGGACVFEGMDEGFSGEAEEDSSTDSIVAKATGKVTTEQEKVEESEGSFLKAGPWRRLATIFAGPAFNFILGFIIAFIMVNMIVMRDPVATEVVPGGAAEAAGLVAGDRVISMNGQRIRLYEDLILFNAMHDGSDVFLVYERDGEQYQTVLKPTYDEAQRRYMMGIVNSDFVELHGFDSLKYTWYEIRYNVKMTYGSLLMMIKGRVSRDSISGPVGIAVNVVGETYEQTKEYGFQTVLVNMLNIALMLSINLGILNLLPIPALDGGRLFFIIIELFRGKPIPPEKEAFVHFIGIVFFMLLFVFVFFNDIRNIFFG